MLINFVVASRLNLTIFIEHYILFAFLIFICLIVTILIPFKDISYYFDDSHYRKKIHNRMKQNNIHNNVKTYGWCNIHQILSDEEIRKSVDCFISQHESFDTLLKTTSHDFLKKIIDDKYINKSIVESLIENQRKKNNTSNIQEYHKYIELIIGLFDRSELYEKINDASIINIPFEQFRCCSIFKLYKQNLIDVEMVKQKLLIQIKSKGLLSCKRFVENSLKEKLIVISDINDAIKEEFRKTLSITSFFNVTKDIKLEDFYMSDCKYMQYCKSYREWWEINERTDKLMETITKYTDVLLLQLHNKFDLNKIDQEWLEFQKTVTAT